MKSEYLKSIYGLFENVQVMSWDEWRELKPSTDESQKDDNDYGKIEEIIEQTLFILSKESMLTEAVDPKTLASSTREWLRALSQINPNLVKDVNVNSKLNNIIEFTFKNVPMRVMVAGNIVHIESNGGYGGTRGAVERLDVRNIKDNTAFFRVFTLTLEKVVIKS